MAVPAFPGRRRITRVEITNFKSIASCDVKLQPLTILVGRNASGKSNFLEAIDFVAESLSESLDSALRQRGGINEVRRKLGRKKGLRSEGRPPDFRIKLYCEIDSVFAEYELEIAAKRPARYIIKNERCHIIGDGREFSFHVSNGLLRDAKGKKTETPTPSPEKLYLTKNLGDKLAEILFDYLTDLRFYDLNPSEIGDLQAPDTGDALAGDGWNCSSVWKRIVSDDKPRRERILEYLRQVSSGITNVETETVGPKQTLVFTESSNDRTTEFYALNMSEGTLRAFSLLVALFQPASGQQTFVDFVAIEEPEKGVHPAAMAVILDAIREASSFRQILITSHSPELLDQEDIEIDSFLAVAAKDGATIIGPIDGVGRIALQDELYTPGELLRLDQISPALIDP